MMRDAWSPPQLCFPSVAGVCVCVDAMLGAHCFPSHPSSLGRIAFVYRPAPEVWELLRLSSLQRFDVAFGSAKGQALSKVVLHGRRSGRAQEDDGLPQTDLSKEHPVPQENRISPRERAGESGLATLCQVESHFFNGSPFND